MKSERSKILDKIRLRIPGSMLIRKNRSYMDGKVRFEIVSLTKNSAKNC